MKDLNKLFNECKAELDSIGIQYGNIVSIEVNYRAKARYGQCRVVNRARKWEDQLYSINISSLLLADNVPDEGVKNTIIHELLHSCKNCMNHKEDWKKLANVVYRKLGYNIKRTSSCEEKGLEKSVVKPQKTYNYKYVFKCQGCGQKVMRKKKSKFTENYTIYTCGICGGKFEKVDCINVI